MLTTCPECHTAFRVGQVQLDSRRGLVRCGRCNAVFNAYDSLLPELETPEGESASRPSPTRPLRDALGQPASAPVHEQPADAVIGLKLPPADLHEPVARPVAEAPPAAVAVSAYAAAAEAAATPEGGEETADDILLSELPIRREAPAPFTWRSAAWGGAALLLAATLLLQAAYFMRGEWSAWFPGARPYFVQACATLGCRVPLPQDIDALRIEASSLENNPDDKRHAQLRFSLSNRADQAIAWPHIVVNLTNTANAVVVRKVFAPAEYLPRGSGVERGIPAGEETEIQLDLEFQGVEPFGYRIEKRYF